MLSRIWFGFFLISFLWACWLGLLQQNTVIFADMVQAIFSSAKQSVEIILGLIGALCFWLGIFQVAKMAGVVDKLAIAIAPLLRRLMPDVPPHHPAHASVTLNLAANILGLDNAATPFGLKAMKDLQTLNPSPTVATNAQILFIVLNSSSVTLIPLSIFMYRSQLGSPNPAMVFLPIILATSASTLAALFSVAWIQKIKLWQPVILGYLFSFAVLLSGMMIYFNTLSPEALLQQSQFVANFILMGLIILFLTAGIVKKVDVYATFIQGAKQGVMIGIKILPYLVAMLAAIALLRASHVLDTLLSGVGHGIRLMGLDDQFVPALTTAFMKPLSGSGARATMLETMQHYGVDAFPSLVSAVVQGSTETTFYVLSVYFGCVGILHGRHALGCALLADLVGVVTAILLCYWFF